MFWQVRVWMIPVMTVDAPLDDEEALESASTVGTSGWVSMDLEAALARLPDGARHVFVLHDVEGYRHEEIGEMLEIAVGTSKSQLHRARMLLRQHLAA